MRAGGIVLCGGRSSRMGRPKALLPFGDEVLLQRVVRIVREVVDPVVVVAAPGQELPPLPEDVRIARDDREYLGPLNGLVTGLETLAGLADVVYLSACDAPFLRAEFVRRVLEGLGERSGVSRPMLPASGGLRRSARPVEVVMPDVGGFHHPLAAGYRMSVQVVVRELLAAGNRRLLDLTSLCETLFLGPANFTGVDPELESLRNLNTLAEYERALPPAASREAAGGSP